MQASRAFTRVIAAGSKTTTRNLSMTGSAPASSIITSNRPIQIAGPRLPQSASAPVPDTDTTGKPIRAFNTSRSLKAVKDNSTIDFMYIPDFDPDTQTAPIELRVPTLPWLNPSETSKSAAVEADEPVMIPTIHTVAADGTHIHAPSAMSDVSDSNHFDFEGLAASVASKFSGPADSNASMAKQVWSGFVDDILGPKARTS